MKNTVLIILSSLLIASCVSKGEYKALESKMNNLNDELDSLTVITEEGERTAAMIGEMSVIMDSIEARRKWIRVDLETGIPTDDMKSRLEGIQEYVSKAEYMIGELEKTRSAYASITKKLKAELKEKTKEITALQDLVEKYQTENEQLITTISLKDAQIDEKQRELEVKNIELELIDAKVQELLVKSKLSEAEAYYARGEAYEEAANRTKFAPKKKKRTLQEALELYKKSLDLGYENAQAKITSLEEKVKG
ncbi:MAG: hypothetical protein AAFX87_17760 [Bacteroidota bacterium]